MANRSDGVLLYGGGIDSTALLFYLRSQGLDPHVLFFTYGQKAEALERECLERWVIAEKRLVLPLPLSQITTSNILSGEPVAADVTTNVLEGRNLIFISLAAAWASTLGASSVYVGFHAEPEARPFPDASPEFHLSVNHTLKEALVRSVAVLAPFSDKTRKEIFQWCLTNAPEALSAHTCYESVRGGCGVCTHCQTKAQLLGELCVE